MSEPLPLRMIAAELREIAQGNLEHQDARHLEALARQVERHCRWEPTEVDHQMIRWAASRGVVRLDNGVEAVLIAWRPKSSRAKARIRYPITGRCDNVPVERIAELVPQPHQVREL